jgi:hypothetical protein
MNIKIINVQLRNNFNDCLLLSIFVLFSLRKISGVLKTLQLLNKTMINPGLRVLYFSLSNGEVMSAGQFLFAPVCPLSDSVCPSVHKKCVINFVREVSRKYARGV